MKKNRTRSTCNLLALETLESRPAYAQILPEHCSVSLFGDAIASKTLNLCQKHFLAHALIMINIYVFLCDGSEHTVEDNLFHFYEFWNVISTWIFSMWESNNHEGTAHDD